MKCRICGAPLRKNGDICKSCYEEYCKEEALEKDTNEIYKIKRTYLPSFQLMQYTDLYAIAIIAILVFGIQQYWGALLLSILVSLVILGVLMFLQKRKAINTSCTFFDKKIVYKYKDRKKVLAYSDLKEVTYYQTFRQKLFKLADLQFHPNGGTYLIGGFEVKNVANIENVWPQIEEIIESKKEK